MLVLNHQLQENLWKKSWQFDIFEYTDIWFYLEIALRICAITSDLKWKVQLYPKPFDMTHIPEPYNSGWSVVPGTIGTKVIPLYQSIPWECHLNTVHEICKTSGQHLWHNYLKCGSKSSVLNNEDIGHWYKNFGTLAADDLAPDGAKSFAAIVLVFFPLS